VIRPYVADPAQIGRVFDETVSAGRSDRSDAANRAPSQPSHADL